MRREQPEQPLRVLGEPRIAELRSGGGVDRRRDLRLIGQKIDAQVIRQRAIEHFLVDETFGVKASEGVIITGVLQNGPAAQAGMRPGDVIAQVAGKPVRNVSELLTAVAALKPGEKAPFEIQRGDGTVELQISPGVRPSPQRAVRR